MPPIASMITNSRSPSRSTPVSTGTALDWGGSKNAEYKTSKTMSQISDRYSHTPTDVSEEGPHSISSYLSDMIRDQKGLLEKEKRQPWLDAAGEIIWEPWRVTLGKVMLSDTLEMVLAIIILFNCILICLETDQEARCYPKYKDDLDDCEWASHKNPFLTISNNILLGIYTAEMVLNMVVWRSIYFTKTMYQFDFLVCMSGWATLVFHSLMRISWLRILRIVRLLRNVKYFNSIPELYMLSAGFSGAMHAMFFGGFVLIGLLAFFSILLVQLIHPVNASIEYGPECERCDRGFASIKSSMLTLFQQIVAGDSWGMISVPIVEESRLGLLLPFTQLVIGIGAMNLILAVVVDRAVEARETNQVQKLMKELQEQQDRKRELLELLHNMDDDQSGTINRHEVEIAVDRDKCFREKMQKTGVKKAEIGEIVDSLEGKSGEIAYKEFCEAIDSIETADVRKTVVLLKMNLVTMRREILGRFRAQDKVLLRQSEMLESLSSFSSSGGGWQFPAEVAKNSKARDGSPKTKDSTVTAESIEPALSWDVRSEESKTHDLFQCESNDKAPKLQNSPRHGSPRQEARACMDEIRLCEARVVRQARDAHDSLQKLEACWRNSLDLLAETTFLFHGSLEEDATMCLFDEVLGYAARHHYSLQARRRTSFQEMATDLDSDIASLRSYCKLLTCRNGTHDGMQACNSLVDLCPSLPRTPRSPRQSPRVPWRFDPLASQDAPQTP